MLETGGVTFGSCALFEDDLRAGRMHAHTVDGFEHHRRVVVLAQSDDLMETWAGYYEKLAPSCAATRAPDLADS